MKDDTEIKAVLAMLDTDGPSICFDMTYEQGVEEALQWVLGELPDEDFSPLVD